MGGNTQELDGSEREDFIASIFRDTLSLLQGYDAPGFKVELLQAGEVDGRPVEQVMVTDETHKLTVRLAIDPQTHLLLKRFYTANIMGAPGEMAETLSDYREVAGVKMPFVSRLELNGQKLGEAKVVEAKINQDVKDELFRKP